jgi:hypothetical protein
MVHPAQVLKLAVRHQADEVARSVHACAPGAERIGHVPFRRQSRPPQVAAGDAGAG